LRADVGPSP